MDSVIEATNAGVGSACSKIVVYPLDLVKTRMATDPQAKTVLSTFATIQREKGLSGLYKGIQPKLVKSITGKVLYFYIYSSLSKLVADSDGQLSTIANMIVGFFSEVIELPVIMPLEAIVSRVQSSKSDEGGIDAAKQMYQEGGLQGFYVSLDAYILGALQPSIQMTLFDQIRPMILGGARKELSAMEAFLLATLASSVAVTCTYPMDLARTINQSRHTGEKSKGLGETLKDIIKTDGFVGMFKGLQPQLMQSVLSSAIMLMVKEKIKATTTKFMIWLIVLLGFKKKSIST